MKISAKGLELIKAFEALRLKAYLCPANVPTIGYGHTKTARIGQAITEKQAEDLLLSDLIGFQYGVDKLVTVDINQNQFDALMSFAFNFGLGALKRSTLLKRVNENANDPAIRNEFLKWNKADGKVLSGLTKRRSAEAELYFSDGSSATH